MKHIYVILAAFTLTMSANVAMASSGCGTNQERVYDDFETYHCECKDGYHDSDTTDHQLTCVAD